jgi:hypothetical protein
MKRFPIFAALIGLASCSSGAGFHDLAQRDSAMAAFRSGQASLPCGDGLECGLKWAGAKATVERYAQASDWNGLAESVLSIGYDTDLSWYYLGAAAQNLGYNRAARVYYEASIQRTTAGGLAACNASLGLCGSANLPMDAQRMLAAVTATRGTTAEQRPRAAPPTAVTNAPAAVSTSTTRTWETPSPSTTAASSPAWQTPPQAGQSQPASAAAGGWENPTPTSAPK